MNKIFENFPESDRCPICMTNEDKPCFLLSIDGTTEGRNCQAQPTHVHCITENLNILNFDKYIGIIYRYV